MIYSNVIITEKDIAALESQIAEMRADNIEAYDNIDSSVDLRKIYKIATKKLGMIHAEPDKQFSYENKRGDRIIQYSDIPEK